MVSLIKNTASCASWGRDCMCSFALHEAKSFLDFFAEDADEVLSETGGNEV